MLPTFPLTFKKSIKISRMQITTNENISEWEVLSIIITHYSLIYIDITKKKINCFVPIFR